MAAPLIRPLQAQGGTFYAFSSGARDLTRTINNSQLKFEFSKFVLLNLPNIQTPIHKENYIQFRTIDGAIFNGLNADDNINLAESFQNYVLNLESLILSNENYDSSVKRTTAERIFFKWLKELGAIRFRLANSNEKNPAILDKRFVEEDTILSGTRRYQRVVEYIGNIDVINHVDKAGESYQEIYINIPTRVGNTPVILFEAISDVNYHPNMIIAGNNEYINGRNSSTIHPAGLSIKAFYDYDDVVIYNNSQNANWHNNALVDAYFTEPNIFDDPSNLDIIKSALDYTAAGASNFTDIHYLRSKLDGISIDFNAESYADIVMDPSIATIQEYNSSVKSKNFEFNTILIYYDIYEVSNPTNRVTNLYGVLFLNNITPFGGGGGFIERFKKVKPNPITGLNGNSYGLKINLKQDISINNVSVVKVINDYNTFSMDLFLDVSVKMQEAIKSLYEVQTNFYDLSNKITELENLFFTNIDTRELKARLDALEAQLQNSNLAIANYTTLLDLIGQTNDRIQAIINNKLPINLQYNTDVIKEGDGILIDKSVPNKIKIVNKNQKYNINKLYKDNQYSIIIDANNPLNLNQNDIKAYIKLNKFTNLVRVNTYGLALNNIKFYIDDLGNKFKEGQVIRWVFENDLLLNGKNIIFFTDKINKFGFGPLNKMIGTIQASELISQKPIIELICLDEINYNFAIDILR